MTDAYIIDAARSPRGKRKGGSLNGMHPVELAAQIVDKTVARNKIPGQEVDDLLIGCVTQAHEQGGNVGREISLVSNLPESVPGLVMNRYCASALQAVNMGAHAIMSGMQDLVLAGGVESMTRVLMDSDDPTYSPAAMKKYGPNFMHQGIAAENIAKKWQLSRADVDAFAAHSQAKAEAAIADNRFKKSIISVDVPASDDQPAFTFEKDEHPRPGTTVETLSGLKPVFDPEGVVTAGNASGVVDGAAIVVLASKEKAQALNLIPRAKITTTVIVGSDPVLMLTGPIPASRKALEKAGLDVSDIDLWEINEAFAPIPIVTMKEVGIDEARVNVNGGAIALGHPLGATGAVLLGTLLDELEARDLRRGLVTLCTGMGMGIATIIDRQV